MIPFNIEHDEMTDSNFTKILCDKFMNDDKDTFQKIMNYEPYELDEKLDDVVSLCSVGGDVFSDTDNFSLCSVSSEEDTSDDDSNHVQRLAGDHIFREEEKCNLDMPIQRRNSTGRIIPKIDFIRPDMYTSQQFKSRDKVEIPSFAAYTAHNEVVTPQSSQPFRSQNTINTGNSFCKYSFDKLLTNLEISMRRTEMTRSAVLKQANSFYGNSNVPCSTKSRAISPCSNKSPVRKKRKSI